MRRRWRQGLVLAGAVLAGRLGAAVPAAAAESWVLALPDSASTAAAVLRLGDVATGPLPAAVADVVLAGAERPGATVVVDRRTVLRRLVEAGLTAGLARCAGAERCVVRFTARGADEAAVRERLGELLAPLLPPAPAGAPANWFEVDVRIPDFGPDWTLELVEPRPLQPGRNLVRLRLSGGGRAARFTAGVLGHVFGETATPRGEIAPGTALAPEQFLWEWRDLALAPPGLVTARTELVGRCAARPLGEAAPLRAADLKAVPLVRGGEPVDLAFRRGRVTVTVRGVARQDGALGETVTVRSGITGQLVAGRVAGPGLVEGRR